VHTAKKYEDTKDASLIWEGHKAGRDIGYCHLEKLHNLEVLPPTGFYISCFPHKIRGASAGWTRAVAIFDDALNLDKQLTLHWQRPLNLFATQTKP
jgi:kynurenine formamidase